jgi:hypothetical protein
MTAQIKGYPFELAMADTRPKERDLTLLRLCDVLTS